MTRSTHLRWCRNVALALLASAAAFLAGLPWAHETQVAEARPIEILAISPSICFSLLFQTEPDLVVPLECFDMVHTPSLATVAALAVFDNDPVEAKKQLDARDGVEDGKFRIMPDDFAAIDLDANQLHEKDGTLTILAFVNDDDPVTFETNVGTFDPTPSVGDEDDDWVCDAKDEDCDSDGVAGDGVVVAQLEPCEQRNAVGACLARSELGPGTVTVSQERRMMSLDFAVVGEPDDVEFVVFENTVQAGLDADACEPETTLEGFIEAASAPEKTIVLARALDSEGSQVTGAFIGWETDDESKGIVADSPTITLDLGDLGSGAANIFCGADEPGTVKVTGTIIPLGLNSDGSLCYEGPACLIELDPQAQSDDNSVELTVVGPPARLEMVAEPASLVCDGTTRSSVSATVTDAEGAAVVDGTEVRFDVRVLATADPILAGTIDGVASSIVTPLAGASQGVPVIATAGDVQASVLLVCEETAPTAPSPLPTPPAPPPSAVILPPATGSRGLLAEGGSDIATCGYALAAGGALLVLGALAGLRRSCRRR